MKKIPTLLLVLTLLTILPGRTVAGPAHSVPPADKPVKTFDTRVYIRRQCLVSEKEDLSVSRSTEASKRVKTAFPLIAGIFVPFLIEKALGSLASALKKAGDPQTLTDSGRLPTYLYRLSHESGKNVLRVNPNFGCVLIVRGTFSTPDGDEPATLRFDPPGVFGEPGVEGRNKRKKRLNDNGIPVTEIAALFEAEPKVANDGTALLYESRFLEVADFQGTRSDNKRHVAVGIAITGAGAREDEPLLSLVLFNLGEVKKDTVLLEDDLKKGKARRTNWVGGMSISESSLKAIEAEDFPDPATAGPLGIMPVNFEGSFTETDEGNKLLRFIADVLEGTKGDLSKSLSSEILRDRGQEASDAADAREQLRQEEQSAYGAFLDAEAALSKLGDDATQAERYAKQFEVHRTRHVWCVKYKVLRKLGLAEPRTAPCT